MIDAQGEDAHTPSLSGAPDYCVVFRATLLTWRLARIGRRRQKPTQRPRTTNQGEEEGGLVGWVGEMQKYNTSVGTER